MAVASSTPERRKVVGTRSRAARDVGATFGVGVALMLAVGALTLTRSPPRVVGAGTRSTGTILAIATEAVEVCEGGEALPAGVSAIRLSLAGDYGSRLRVTASSGAQVLTEGARGPDWTGSSVTVPVTPLKQPASHVTLCIDLGPNSEPIIFAGISTPAREAAESSAGQKLTGRVGVEYLGAGRGSWWSRILAVARHMGIGHALTGTWVALLIAALVAAVGLLAMRLALRESRPVERQGGETPVEQTESPSRQTSLGAALGRVPRAAWTCAVIALLNACAWSLIVPPFQGRDEVNHFAYVEQLAENGALPENGHEIGTYSTEETLVLDGLHYGSVVFSPQTPAISTVAEQRTLTEDLHAGASTRGTGEAGVATSEPPLYYAIQTIPYLLARGDILDQLQLMRLVGAIFGALTALLCFLFLREILPGSPWAATVGGLCVALQPLFAFISGSVNPDTMLLTVSAAVFLCLARAFRRGLTRRRALTLGALIAVGFLTKLNFIGLALGVFAGLAVLTAREAKASGRGSSGRQALVSPAIAAAIGVSPASLYALRNILSHHAALGIFSGTAGLLTAHSLLNELSYIWQMWLPRLPGMTHYFKGLATYKDIWFDRSVGLYGWMDTMFPEWVDNLALLPAAALALLCAHELIAQRHALRTRAAELAAYAAMTTGVLVMIGASSYLTDAIGHELAFGEPRYLLPLLPLLGALITLAVRGAQRRWAPAAGATIITLFLAHDIFSQLQVIARYYG
jgi:hypothetical protein